MYQFNQSISQESVAPRGAADKSWLVSVLAHNPRLLTRFAALQRKVRSLSQRQRRWLARRAAVAMTGAALTLALAYPVGAVPTNTISVVNGQVADVNNGQCSLIEAIINARATKANQMRADCTAGNTSGADTIVLPNNGLFQLTAAHNAQFGPTGLPVITGAMTIEGNGSTITRNSADLFRILVVDPGRNLTLRNATISNGVADDDGGGGILNYGTLTVENSVFTDNHAYFGGGAISNEGTATITNSTVDDNSSENSGGGVGNFGTMTINSSTISNNFANYYGAGVYNSQSGQMTINNSTISGNYITPEEGGGIYNNGDMVITNSTVTGNFSYGHGAGILNMPYGTLDLNRTLVSGNYSLNFDTYSFDYSDEIRSVGTITVNNRNVIGHDGDSYSGGFSLGANDIAPAEGLGDILDTTLANNGGPTKTHALVSGSPAIDVAPNNQCTATPINGVDQRGEPRNQNGDGSSSSNECDSGAFELGEGAPPAATDFYASAAKAGSVGGVAFDPADILKFENGNWTMHFDASDVGVTKNVSAFEILNNGHILLSFIANQPISGVGTVTPQDVVEFTPTSTGNNTAGSFQMVLDGSMEGLTTSGEKIDALGLTTDGRLAISTTGAASVPKPGGGMLKGQDEDALGFNVAQQTWSAFFDGTPIPGMQAEDVVALWVDPSTGDVYVSLMNAFNLGGVQGDAKDIVKLAVNGGSYTPSLFWDGSAAGSPQSLDGLEIIQ